MTDELLGCRLSDVLPRLLAEGIQPVVVATSAPGKDDREGTLRVIRIRNNELIVASFPENIPE